MPQEIRNAVVRSLVLEADREAVWRAISSDDGLAGWLAESATVDVRPGGEGVVRFAGGHERRLRVAEVEDGSVDRVPLGAGARCPDAETRVELRLEDAETARRGSPSARRASRGRRTRRRAALAAAAWAWEAVLMALAALVVLVAVA